MDVSPNALTRSRLQVEPARWRRSLFFAVTLATTALSASLMWNILRANGLTFLEWVALLLFCILFLWIAAAFWTAAAGFVMRLVGTDPALLRPDRLADRPLRSRTAIVMPICEEDTDRVAGGVSAVWRLLARHREAHAFDFFLLSDSRQPETAAAEKSAWRALVAEHGAEGRIFYRRRRSPTGRKAGNIAEFVESRGASYDYFIVLDADSVMSAESIVALARLMDANPRAGIIQTLPLPVGGTTWFARILQFSARLNGPMMASGLAFWQLGEANYWGHNAILRMRPFAASCRLPRLPDKSTLGGEVLSHDFVEAALMRRAGFSVWLVPDLGGSWEQIPSNVVDYAARDRRWAQGNLQHLRLLAAPGLHWMSRLHMLNGVMAYLNSLAWLILLMVSTIAACWQAAHLPHYFEPGLFTLFPEWPVYRTAQIFSLLAVTAAVLLLPKVLATILALTDSKLRKGFGGAVTLLNGVFAEQLVSMLIAPAMMLFHSTFIFAALSGRQIGWTKYPRGDRRVGLAESMDRHAWHIAFAAIWGGTVLVLAPAFLPWLMPVLTGLLCSAPLTALTSHGHGAPAVRLFSTPEETAKPPELEAAEAAMRYSPRRDAIKVGGCPPARG